MVLRPTFLSRERKDPLFSVAMGMRPKYLPGNSYPVIPAMSRVATRLFREWKTIEG
ncbi:Hypothetical protein DEACI_2707 [Acididesulfobacillus acetoxydans]|uniref:Uncharacterized protein n=1 Tax=Acididesulfobacillus acetoxydans TaxID=1561005 RepID=A0A8S0Y3G2_9FIRM|nr:Hypothetical protein DEACI_2707 [Acididesulfobacillus acetoxydans]CEJ08122.1 Hypothetical protein DEACI_2597 [Acididesulfobacillus acetoxydans]